MAVACPGGECVEEMIVCDTTDHVSVYLIQRCDFERRSSLTPRRPVGPACGPESRIKSSLQICVLFEVVCPSRHQLVGVADRVRFRARIARRDGINLWWG